MAWKYKQLGQAEGTTSAVSILAMTAKELRVKLISISNHETTASTYNVWLDDDGTTYDDTTVMAEGIPIPPNDTLSWYVDWGMTVVGGNLAVKAGDASRLTFTVFGEEVEG